MISVSVISQMPEPDELHWEIQSAMLLTAVTCTAQSSSQCLL